MTIASSDEKILVIIIMIVGVVVFSFAFGSLMSVITNLDSRAAKLKQKKFELNSIRKKYKIPDTLYRKFELGTEENTDALIETLPLGLRTDLMLVVNNKIINKIPYFKNKSEQFCAEAATHIKTTNTHANEFVYEVRDPILEIFFMLSGEAAYVVYEGHITVAYSKITTGNIFGELDFFHMDPGVPMARRKFIVKTLSDCEIISFSKEVIFELEKSYPDYIEEIFEFGAFRAKKLSQARDKALKTLHHEVVREEKAQKKLVRAKTTMKSIKRLDSMRVSDIRKGRFRPFINFKCNSHIFPF